MTEPPVLEAIGVSRVFDLSGGGRWRGPPRRVVAVDDASFSIARGTTLALVGESGCGKSTLARLCVGIDRPSGGAIRFEGRVLSDARRQPELRRRVGMVFQDPFASLNPRWRVRDIVAEPIRAFGLAHGRTAVRERVAALLGQVGLAAADGARFPHAFSGGQRQRIAIARALAGQPAFLVCDEPTSALDMSVQAQVLNLLRDLQQAGGLTYLFISHNLAVVRHMADRLGVMYLGRIVELGPADAIFRSPRHPYTRLLLAAVPDLAAPAAPVEVRGELPEPLAAPAGCAFHPRCALARARCAVERPRAVMAGEVRVACHAVAEGWD